MERQNYTASHQAVRVSTRRFENSPYLEKYATNDMLYGIYAHRLDWGVCVFPLPFL